MSRFWQNRYYLSWQEFILPPVRVYCEETGMRATGVPTSVLALNSIDEVKETLNDSNVKMEQLSGVVSAVSQSVSLLHDKHASNLLTNTIELEKIVKKSVCEVLHCHASQQQKSTRPSQNSSIGQFTWNHEWKEDEWNTAGDEVPPARSLSSAELNIFGAKAKFNTFKWTENDLGGYPVPKGFTWPMGEGYFRF